MISRSGGFTVKDMNSTPSPDPYSPNPRDPAAGRVGNRQPLSRVALPIAAGALFLAACDIDIEFNEERIQESFDVSSFNAITIDAPFEVTIRQGETQSVSVSVDVSESVIDDLVVEVVDGELTIDVDSRSINFGRDLTASITVTDLESLDASSASDIVIISLDVDDLDVRTSGASQISMSGSIGTLDLDMSGASQADLDGTTIGTVALELSGASQADFAETDDRINGSIRGASSIDVADATDVGVDTSGASTIDRN